MILLYHKVHPEHKTEWWITPNSFYLQMLDLQSKKVVYLDDYDVSDPEQYVITFDGIYENVLEYAFPILKHFNYPFELFIIGDTVGKGNEFDKVEPYAKFASADTLSKLVEGGGRLQWHSKSHARLTGKTSKKLYDDELTIPSKLQKLDEKGFGWYAYPHGERNEQYRQEVSSRFRGALACGDGDNQNNYDLERLTVFESTRLQETTVTLIIPCYNYGHLVAEAIESALLQTYPPDEILFIDDASSDNSVEVARRYETQIRIEVNEKNLGVVKNFRKAVEMTSGDYICFLGADNRFRSDYIEKTKAVLDANSDVGIAHTHYALFGSRASIVGLESGAKPHPMFPDIFLKEFPDYIPNHDIRNGNYVHGSSMYRRIAYEQAGGYIEDTLQEDAFLFARILDLNWQTKLVDEYVLEYRQHSENQLDIGKSLELENAYLKAKLRNLKESKVYQLALSLDKVRAFLTSPLRLWVKLARWGYLSLKIWRNEGLKVLILEIKRKIG